MAKFGRTDRAAKKLEGQCAALLSAKGGMSSGDLIEVDYFAVQELLEFYKEHKEAAQRIVKVRDALHQVYFLSEIS